MATVKKTPTSKKATAQTDPLEEITSTNPAEAPVPVSVDSEKEQLKSELAELKAQMALMAQMMAQNTAPTTSTPVHKPKKFIPFYNMTTTTLVLKGNTTHDLKGQFAMDKYPENEAKAIISKMPNSLRQGRFYIADADFVRENELEGIYETILNVEQMKSLLTKDSSYVVDIYRNASEGQKSIIVDMVTDKMLKGQSVDANTVRELGKLCGKDLMNIEPLD